MKFSMKIPWKNNRQVSKTWEKSCRSSLDFHGTRTQLFPFDLSLSLIGYSIRVKLASEKTEKCTRDESIGKQRDHRNFQCFRMAVWTDSGADYIIRPSMDIGGKPRMSGVDQPWLKLSA